MPDYLPCPPGNFIIKSKCEKITPGHCVCASKLTRKNSKCDDEPKTYSNVKIEPYDLYIVYDIVSRWLTHFKQTHPKYSGLKLIGICLCQGAAEHFVNPTGGRGINDIDIWMFFMKQEKSICPDFPDRQVYNESFPNDKFGKTANCTNLPGRRIDIMGRSISPSSSIINWLKKGGSGSSAAYLRKSPVILLEKDRYEILEVNDETNKNQRKSVKKLIKEATPIKEVTPIKEEKGKKQNKTKKTHYMLQLERLKHYNKELFDYKATKEQYSWARACQSSAGRQPNVLSKQELDAVIDLYGDKVEWVFLPPPKGTILDIEKLGIKDLIQEFKKRGIESEIIDEKGKPKVKKHDIHKRLGEILSLEPGPQGAIMRLIYNRHEYKEKEKPIWVVAKAGSDKKKDNYYICSHYWCIRDNIPLLPFELIKNDNKCPQCNGKIISDFKHRNEDETVIKRVGRPGGSHEVQDLAGYLEISHPDSLALPCCYVMLKPEQMMPPAGTHIYS